MQKLIADLLNLPDHVRRGDFVLKLSEGVERADETLNTYVVTPQLVNCFDQAMGLIQTALSGRTSKACYLHGSFGSGKSIQVALGDVDGDGDLEAVVANSNGQAQQVHLNNGDGTFGAATTFGSGSS